MGDRSIVVESEKERNSSGGCDPSARSSGWLEGHLQGFVKPYLGLIPEMKGCVNPFTPHEMSVIKNLWRSVKRESNGLPVLLAGRDVFIFEILARREDFPTIFRPDISRLTVEHVKEDYSKHYLFDTGFEGSIPRLLRCKFFNLASANSGMGLGTWGRHRPLTVRPIQSFPRMQGSRSLALKIEGTPKYWRRGFIKYDSPIGGFNMDCRIAQDPTDAIEFLAAARLTIAIYKDSSPKFSGGQMQAKPKQFKDWTTQDWLD